VYRIGEPEGAGAMAADIPLIVAVVDKNGVTRYA
jgi:hypothetical protein